MMNTFGRRLPKSIRKKIDDYDLLAYDNAFFGGIDPSVKLEHNWSKL
jgi:hypothetical protein